MAFDLITYTSQTSYAATAMTDIESQALLSKKSDNEEGASKVSAQMALSRQKNIRKTSDMEELATAHQSSKKIANICDLISSFISNIVICFAALIKAVPKWFVGQRHRKVAGGAPGSNKNANTIISSNGGGFELTRLAQFDGEDSNPLLSSISRNNSFLDLKDVQVTSESAEQLSASPPILSSASMRALVKNGLPTHLHWKKWKRLFSSTRDGDCFTTMLYKVKGHKYTVVIVKTMQGHVCGGFAASEWASGGDSYYGTGQAFLFSFTRLGDEDEEELQLYKWTGSNMYIQLCDVGSTRLAMGGGGKKGCFGLAVQNNFYEGTTGTCDTFANKPLVGDGNDSFDILSVEIYGFVDMWS